MHETYDNEIKSSRPATRHTRLGIVGGGQLAKMTALAALQLGCDVVVLEKNNYSPAAQLATHSLVGDWNDPEALVKLASQVDVVSIENEFINADALAAIENCGHLLYPGTATLRRVQDKFIQKQTFLEAGLSTPKFTAVRDVQELSRAGNDFGWPVVLKTRRNGYDGKGNFTVRSESEISQGWEALGGPKNNELYVEAFCPYVSELAVIVVRSRDGASVVYPVVETVQRNHICHMVKAPAVVPRELAEEAASLARRAIDAIAGVGSFGVEMFLTREGQVLLNELAPRVHNSGHYTIEACVCSQFENHVRAVLGWPLGSVAMRAPAAVMVNLLGVGKGPGTPRGLERALGVAGAHVHIYGKAMSGAGRKMGHVTALGQNLAEAEAIAQKAAECILFGAKS
ncbi:MAG: 5-(carboxyamino)imidazole ribonucleotide synthase [Verrucomicrobiales bacterium]|nr:5-(carboxyamino)imidazole ribonucleotide synthase [Verrucomicrobiales bacterium]